MTTVFLDGLNVSTNLNLYTMTLGVHHDSWCLDAPGSWTVYPIALSVPCLYEPLIMEHKLGEPTTRSVFWVFLIQ